MSPDFIYDLFDGDAASRMNADATQEFHYTRIDPPQYEKISGIRREGIGPELDDERRRQEEGYCTCEWHCEVVECSDWANR